MATSQRRGSFVLGFIAAVAVIVVAFGALTAFQVGTGAWRVWDEWQCVEGEAPARADGLYKYCRPLDPPRPAGEGCGPLGTRPRACTDRSQWGKVARTTAQGDVETDCATANAPLPQGWTRR